jgi:hypothetical protein
VPKAGTTGANSNRPTKNTGEVIDVVPAPIAVVCDIGSRFRGETHQAAFAGDEPLLRHVRTHVGSQLPGPWRTHVNPQIRISARSPA